jgi:hypothetical protein
MLEAGPAGVFGRGAGISVTGLTSVGKLACLVSCFVEVPL